MTHHVQFGSTIHRANNKSEHQVQKLANFLFHFLTSQAIEQVNLSLLTQDPIASKKMEPTAHQEFLESLNIDEQEVASIREWSKK
ncbi:hypothetical protein A3712_03515 [Vibrio sp. HI00D65]|nr:hypothetical protein A3712_03515 [Vibrio sp. HI00D65]